MVIINKCKLEYNVMSFKVVTVSCLKILLTFLFGGIEFKYDMKPCSSLNPFKLNLNLEIDYHHFKANEENLENSSQLICSNDFQSLIHLA